MLNPLAANALGTITLNVMGKLDTGTNSAGWGFATTGTGETPEWCKDWGKDATAFSAATLDDCVWFSPGCAGKP